MGAFGAQDFSFELLSLLLRQFAQRQKPRARLAFDGCLEANGEILKMRLKFISGVFRHKLDCVSKSGHVLRNGAPLAFVDFPFAENGHRFESAFGEATPYG